MARWVLGHERELTRIAYLLLAFSTLFGGKLLGRISALRNRPILYRTLFVAIPATLVIAAAYYYMDEEWLRNSFPSSAAYALYASNYQLPLDPLIIAAVYGIVIGAIPAVMLPWAQRPWRVLRYFSDSWDPEVLDTKQKLKLLSGWITGLSVFFGALAWMSLVTQLFYSAQYVFRVQGWLGGHVPSPSVLLMVIAFVTAVIVVVLYGGYARLMIPNAKTLEDDLVPMTHGDADNEPKRRVERWGDSFFALLFNASVIIYGIEWIASFAGMIAYSWAVQSSTSYPGFTTSSAAIAILLALLVVSALVPIALRWLADQMGGKTLTFICAALATVGSLLRFIVYLAHIVRY